MFKKENLLDRFLNSDHPGVTAAKFLLVIVAASGLVFVGAAAPGILAAAKKFKLAKSHSKESLASAFYTLKSRKLIQIIEDKNGHCRVILTNKGKKRIADFSIDNLLIGRPKAWDKKWRVLIFDIPTKPKINEIARLSLRHRIKEIGFIQLQKSTWVYPFPCEDELLFISEYYNVSKHIEILTVEKMMHEEKLKEKFELA